MSLDRVDPECRPALEAFRETAGGMNDLPLPQRRAMVSTLEAQLAAGVPVSDDVVVEDRTIPGPTGGPEIPIRIYRPLTTQTAAPGIYYIHGGAMVVDGLETGHVDCLRFCSELGAVVVNVDYRLSPENPHPVPGEDCYAGLVEVGEEEIRWLVGLP